MHPFEPPDPQAMAAWYVRNRERSGRLFDAIRPEAYAARPIALRNPICFYEGHLPAFAVNTLLKRGLGEPGLDADFEVLFERGIDPESEAAVPAASLWPPRAAIRAYAAAADQAILEALGRGDAGAADAAATVLEHEPMHQETLLYIWHRLAYDEKVRPASLPPLRIGGEPPPRRQVRIPAGVATVGAGPEESFAWDNERPRHTVEVAAFSIDVQSVTNRDYLEFLEGGGYEDESLWSEEGWRWLEGNGARHPLFWELHRGAWFWRGMWDLVPLPTAWPVYVAHAEASAFARWKGRRLPTEAEYHRAAFGSPSGGERRHPWGDAPPDATRGNFDFGSWDPVPAGSFPRGASAWGVHDLVGNGWEWTSTVFAGFEGFRPMATYPQYSVDFFDGKHYVMKGASPGTAKELIRPSFRNWFRATYPYVYAKFRTAGD